ncbi:MAG: hypothetical protein QXY39_07140 [Thermofilaceae archaeon]
MRILVADISGPDYVRPPVAEFLGIQAHIPPPGELLWRGHQIIIRPGISFEEAKKLKPDFIFALTGWHGIKAERSKFYEAFYNEGVPIFTWGDDSNIPKLMAEVKRVGGCQAKSTRILVAKPDHPIMSGVTDKDIRTSECDERTLVKSVSRNVMGFAYDPDNSSWEILYLEEWFGNKRWLHYHPYPCPPPKLIDNFLAYMTRPKSKAPTLIALGLIGGAAVAIIGAILAVKRRRP